MIGILTGKGVNVQRRQAGSVSIDDELIDLQTSSLPPTWLRAVVEDVLFDINAFSDERKNELLDRLVNPELLLKAPYNSIIARVITNAEGRRADNPAVFYPMLSHTSFPIKPGEHVWVMFENPERSQVNGFWLSRIVEPKDINDQNFTHADRKFDDRSELTTVEKAIGFEIIDSKPGFPNGGNTEESFTLQDPLAYQKIENNAIANRIFVREPVPRWKKRPGDYVIEGSNNTLISLGEDRTSTAFEGKDLNTKKIDNDIQEKAGTIDIVAGRSRELPEPGSPGKLTAPTIIKNSRNFLEVDKVINNQNENEGNPDFKKDSARIYVSMNTRGDSNLGTISDNLPKTFNNNNVDTIDKGSFVIEKADHIRIIARRDQDAKPSPINGTIRIIKEGVQNSENGDGMGAILIEQDGTVIIDGPHIVIGSDALEKNHGAGTHVFIGRGAKESILLGDTLIDLITTYTNDIKQQLDSLELALELFMTDLAGPGGLGNFGLPLPISAITPASATATIPKLAKFKADISIITKKLQDKLPTAKSKIGKTR